MYRALEKLHRALLVAAIMGVTGVASAQPLSAPSAPTDKEILSAQITYYALLISRLQSDAAEREKAWAEYSKPLWQQPTNLSGLPSSSEVGGK